MLPVKRACPIPHGQHALQLYKCTPPQRSAAPTTLHMYYTHNVPTPHEESCNMRRYIKHGRKPASRKGTCVQCPRVCLVCTPL